MYSAPGGRSYMTYSVVKALVSGLPTLGHQDWRVAVQE